MTIPKKVERKTLYQDEMDYKGLDINDIIKYGADIEQERGWNERHDIAEKRIEAIVEILYEIDELISNENPLKGKELLENLIDQLQPPEQSPNEELKSEMKGKGV